MFHFSNLFFLVSSAFICFALTKIFIRKGGLSADVPNQRSSHVVITPRGGGVTVFASVFVLYFVDQLASFFAALDFVGWSLSPSECVLLVAICGIFLLGVFEDRNELAARLRLGVEFIAAAAVAYVGYGIEQISFFGSNFEIGSIFGGVLTVLYIVWMTNLYNFMDGLNGIAVWQAIVATSFYFFVAVDLGNATLTILSVIQIGSLIGFLPLNFPKAKIFLGDSGSLTFGFIFAVLPLYVHDASPNFNPLIGVMPLLVFCADSTLTLFRRMLRGENLALAHRSHYYQRSSSFDRNRHVRTTLIFTILSSFFCLSALSFYFSRDKFAYIFFAIGSIALVTVFSAIDLNVPRRFNSNKIKKEIEN